MKYIQQQREATVDELNMLIMESTELAILLKEANRKEAHRMKVLAINTKLALFLLQETDSVITGDQFIRERNNFLNELHEVLS